jgi:glutamate synthase (NADPH/NADH) small chain
MDFLRASTKSLLDGTDRTIDAAGKDVIVIGGGDTGTDCVGSSIRQKCASVQQIEIMPKPPENRRDDNPWPQWPAVLKTDYGQQEAIELYGRDPRIWQTTVKGFEGDINGQVKAVHTVEVNWQRDGEGRMTPVEVPGSEKVLPAQLVLLAMGFLGPDDRIPQNLALKRDPRSNIAADDQNYKTSIDGIFCAGDMRRGQSLVVWAINEGRRAARACDEYLTGSSLLPG